MKPFKSKKAERKYMKRLKKAQKKFDHLHANSPILTLRPFNKLTASEAERLAILSEELGECVQAVGKILRHGYESFSPKTRNPITNRNALEMEIGDVAYILWRMCDEGDIDEDSVERWGEAKAKKIERYLHHNDAKLMLD